MCRQGSNDCQQGHEALKGPGLQDPGALCYTIPVFWRRSSILKHLFGFQKIFKNSKIYHILEERHLNFIKWTLLKTSCCICP